MPEHDPNEFPEQVPTPCYVCDEQVLIRNLSILQQIQRRTDCRILLALKAFSMFEMFPLMSRYLAGTAASSLYEARLGYEEFGDSVHLYAPAYRPAEMQEMLRYCRHIVFNSFSQWQRFQPELRRCSREVKCGMRINPEHSEVDVSIYDPCRKGSRLGVTRAEFEPDSMTGISGLHFHNLCGHNADALDRTLSVVEHNFGHILPAMSWVNFGGGHHIARADYDVDRLCELVTGFRTKYDVEVFLEPGEGILLDAGVLVGSVVDVLSNGCAILDVSATAHMPDVLEMPYRPDITGAAQPGEKAYTYTLGGPTCLAGDEIGQYSFSTPLEPGSRVVFEDMVSYTMVKNTLFNGVSLPAIAVKEAGSGQVRVVREFGYEDYRNRLS